MRKWIDLFESQNPNLRCWWKRNRTIPVSRVYDHATYLINNYEEMGLPEEIMDCDDNEEREQIALQHGWVRINIDETTIPYLIGYDLRTVRAASRWVVEQKPTLERLSVEIYQPAFRQISLTDMNEIESFVKGRREE